MAQRCLPAANQFPAHAAMNPRHNGEEYMRRGTECHEHNLSTAHKANECTNGLHTQCPVTGRLPRGPTSHPPCKCGAGALSTFQDCPLLPESHSRRPRKKSIGEAQQGTAAPRLRLGRAAAPGWQCCDASPRRGVAEVVAAEQRVQALRRLALRLQHQPAVAQRLHVPRQVLHTQRRRQVLQNVHGMLAPAQCYLNSVRHAPVGHAGGAAPNAVVAVALRQPQVRHVLPYARLQVGAQAVQRCPGRDDAAAARSGGRRHRQRVDQRHVRRRGAGRRRWPRRRRRGAGWLRRTTQLRQLIPTPHQQSRPAAARHDDRGAACDVGGTREEAHVAADRARDVRSVRGRDEAARQHEHAVGRHARRQAIGRAPGQ
eukprot:363291-Chlamydomonas_euryale.AAC.35